jgi:hypothetical protein
MPCRGRSKEIAALKQTLGQTAHPARLDRPETSKTGFFRPVLAKSVLVKNRAYCKLVSNQGGRPVVGHLLYVVWLFVFRSLLFVVCCLL